MLNKKEKTERVKELLDERIREDEKKGVWLLKLFKEAPVEDEGGDE